MSITMNVIGGLGNQMFQYAAGFALAQSQPSNLILDVDGFDQYDLRSFMLSHYQIPNSVKIEKTPVSIWRKRLNKYFDCPNLYVEKDYHFNPDVFDIKVPCHFFGYFQSEKYFQDYSDDIRRHFELKDALSQNSQGFKAQIEESDVAVSLHVRRGDYVTNAMAQKTHGTASSVYYRQAIEMMMTMYGTDVVFVIFSDDTAYVETEYAWLKNKIVVSGNDDAPHEDMALMSNCTHHILANSSFSWWGAWLNKNPDKTVIAPRMWFAPQVLKKRYIFDLFPEGWILL